MGERVKGRAQKVALSVDATIGELERVVEALKPDMLQLHGKETPEHVNAVRSRFHLPVMKALPIESRADLSPIRIYEKVADWLLFDGHAPRDATRPGGLGKTFDWTVLQNLDFQGPFMLSAGSMRPMSPRRCASPARRRSMCRRASSALLARKTRRRFAPSSAPRGGSRRQNRPQSNPINRRGRARRVPPPM